MKVFKSDATDPYINNTQFIEINRIEKTYLGKKYEEITYKKEHRLCWKLTHICLVILACLTIIPLCVAWDGVKKLWRRGITGQEIKIVTLVKSQLVQPEKKSHAQEEILKISPKTQDKSPQNKDHGVVSEKKAEKFKNQKNTNAQKLDKDLDEKSKLKGKILESRPELKGNVNIEKMNEEQLEILNSTVGKGSIKKNNTVIKILEDVVEIWISGKRTVEVDINKAKIKADIWKFRPEFQKNSFIETMDLKQLQILKSLIIKQDAKKRGSKAYQVLNDFIDQMKNGTQLTWDWDDEGLLAVSKQVDQALNKISAIKYLDNDKLGVCKNGTSKESLEMVDHSDLKWLEDKKLFSKHTSSLSGGAANNDKEKSIRICEKVLFYEPTEVPEPDWFHITKQKWLLRRWKQYREQEEQEDLGDLDAKKSKVEISKEFIRKVAEAKAKVGNIN